MTDKTVVAIDVQAESFDAFLAKFTQYDAMLKEQSVMWKQINAAMGGGRSPGFNTYVGRTGTTANPFDDDKRWARVNKHTSQFSQFLRGSVRDSSLLGRNLAGIATGLLKWGAIGVGVGAFGTAGLIGNVAGDRKQAQELGVTIGEKKAAESVYKRFYGDVDGILANIEKLRHDADWPTLRQATGLEYDEIKESSNVDLLQKILEYSHNRQDFDISNNDSISLKRFKDLGLDKLMTWGDLRTHKMVAQDEISSAGKDIGPEVKRQNINDKTAAEFQKFVQQWTDLGNTIEAVFTKKIKELGPLLDSLNENLSDLVKWIDEKTESFLINPSGQLKEWDKKYLGGDTDKEYIGGQKRRIVDDSGWFDGYSLKSTKERSLSNLRTMEAWATDKDSTSGYLGDHDKSLNKKEMAKRLALPIKEHLENAWEGVKKWHDEIPKLPPGYLNPNYQKEPPQPSPSNKKMNFNHNIKSNVNITVSNQTGQDINVTANAMRGA